MSATRTPTASPTTTSRTAACSARTGPPATRSRSRTTSTTGHGPRRRRHRRRRRARRRRRPGPRRHPEPHGAEPHRRVRRRPTGRAPASRTGCAEASGHEPPERLRPGEPVQPVPAVPSRGPARCPSTSGTGAPFDGSPNWYSLQLVPSRTPPQRPGPAFVRALVVKGCAAAADAVLMSRPLLPWAALAVARRRLAGLARPARLRLHRLRGRGRARVRRARARLLRAVPRAVPRLRRLADHARAVRAGRGRAGRGTGRRLPRRRRCRACWPAPRSAIVLAASLLARGAGRGTIAIVVGLCAANPITLRALDIGHPEELLGAVLCAGAVLAALRGRATLAGVLLGLAMANKAWAVLAVGPVLLALPERRRRSLLIAGAIAIAFVPPLLLAAPPSASPGGAVHTDEIFQPWQVWWFLGATGRGDPRRRRGRQGGLPRRPGLAVADQPPADRRGRAAAVAAGLAPALGPAAAARAAVHAALRARPLEHRLLRAAGDHRAGDVGGRAHRAHASVRARADDGDLGDLAVGRARGLGRRRGARLPRAGACRFAGLLAWRLYAPALPAMPALSRGGRASVWSTTQ